MFNMFKPFAYHITRVYVCGCILYNTYRGVKKRRQRETEQVVFVMTLYS